jgi:hypothetical protein
MFTIVKQIYTMAFQLKLPNSMKIHLVFHVSLLESRAPKLFDKLKFESEVKTVEEQGVGARSLARNTLEG